MTTSPAAAHPSISPTPACCRWSWTRCAIGSRSVTSMAFASISRRRSRAPRTASTATAVFSLRSGKIRCWLPSSSSPSPGTSAWDLGMGGYQVGAYPSQWSEWNDRYRSTMRRYWSGEGSLIGEVSSRMTASSDLFNHDGRKPRASVNHITVHDGFTLADLFSYNQKHNEANGEDNRDGSSDNHSNNCGHEGPTDDPAIVALRRQLRKNQLACLLLAQGLPLILAGDEVGNTQGGNNNAYCQDNEIGWVSWEGLGREGDDLTDFIGHMTALRHRFPQIRSRRWLDG